MRIETRREVIRVSRRERQKLVDVSEMLIEIVEQSSDRDLKSVAKLGHDAIRSMLITYIELDPNMEPPNAGH